MLKVSDIQKLDVTSIKNKIEELKKELFELRLQRSTSSVEKPHMFKEIKKDIARLLTVLSNKN